MILIDYHLLFIAVTLVLMIITILLIFFAELKGIEIYGMMLLCGLNWLLCLISMLGFFGIGIPYYDPTTNTVATELVPDMYPFFSYFMLIFFMQIVFLYYLAGMHIKQTWEIKESEEKIRFDI